LPYDRMLTRAIIISVYTYTYIYSNIYIKHIYDDAKEC